MYLPNKNILLVAFSLLFCGFWSTAQSELQFQLELDSIKAQMKRRDYSLAHQSINDFNRENDFSKDSYWAGQLAFLDGSVYDKQLDRLNAVEQLEQARATFLQIDSLDLALESARKLFLIYYRENEHEISLKYCEEALDIAKKIGDSAILSEWYNFMGNNFVRQGFFEKALEAEKSSLNYANEANNESLKSFCYSTIGEIHFNNNELDSADFYYQKTLDLKLKLGTNTGWLKSKIGKLKISQHRVAEAIQLCEEGFKESAAMSFKRPMIFNCECLNEAYALNKDYEKAFIWLNKKLELEASTESDNRRDEITRLNYEIQYQQQALGDSIEREKEKQVAKAEMNLKDEKIAHEKSVKFYLYLGLGLLVLFVAFVFNRLQVIRRQKLEIAAQKDKSESLREKAEQHRLIAEEKNTEILDSINYAKRIQTAILPPVKVLDQHLPENFVSYIPKDIVAGDFYWLESKEESVIFAAADCTGHGVPGAMVSVICNNGLNRSVREYDLSDPGQILDKTREIVISEFEKSEEEVKDGMDIALCSLNKNNRLQYAGANNPLWIIRKGREEVEEVRANKQPIGKFLNPVPYETHTVQLQEGDQFYVFSDGFADQFGGDKGKKFKSSNFKKLLLKIKDHSMKQQKEIIEKEFYNWKNQLEQLDDVCIIGVRV